MFCVVIVSAAVWSNDAVLNLSDSMLGLTVVPNLIAVWLLFPRVRAATRDYFHRLCTGQMEADAKEAVEI